MSLSRLVLTEDDQRRFRAVLEALLSPMDGETDTWLGRVCDCVKALTGADCAGVIIRADERVSTHCSDRSNDVAAKYVELIPNRFYDALGLVAATKSPAGSRNAAELIVHHERANGRKFGERGVALFKLLHPAFTAAMRTHVKLASQRHELESVLDALVDGYLLCDAFGRVLHVTPALSMLLRADPERDRLSGELLATTRILAHLINSCAELSSAGSCFPLDREVRTASATYTVRGTLMPEGVLASTRVIMVALCPRMPARAGEAELQERFGLTQRQARVALLLADGRSNAEIACVLSISPHTARHHTEQVLLKLGAKSRAEVASKLLA
jgi:DNA-binding CsgD family transcriptional regulator